MRRLLAGLLILGTIASVGFLWGSDLPLGVPDEWTWHRIDYSDTSIALLLPGIVWMAITGGAVIGMITVGSRRSEFCTGVERIGWLCGLTLAGCGWLLALQNVPPTPHGTEKIPFVLYYPGSSGYFHTARYDVEDTGEFLAGYEDRMAKGDVLHEGTHPPGLVLLHRGLISLCERFPACTDFLISTELEGVTGALDNIEENSHFTDKPLRNTDRAALWLGALLTLFLSGATFLPLYGLLRVYCTSGEAVRLASLWFFIPALAVFQPKSDALYPFLATVFLWLWVGGIGRNQFLRCILAGVVFWLGMFCSLAMLPVAALAVLTTLNYWWTRNEDGKPISYFLKQVAWALLGFSIPVALMWGLTDLNLFSIWHWNYKNHGGFYDQYPRTWTSWAGVNLLELSFSLGFPVFLLAFTSLFRRHAEMSLWRPALCIWLVWGILWLSGKNMGEAARLWLVVYPFFLWGLSSYSSRQPPNTQREFPVNWWLLMSLQVTVCIATTLRVTGFHFQG